MKITNNPKQSFGLSQSAPAVVSTTTVVNNTQPQSSSNARFKSLITQAIEKTKRYPLHTIRGWQEVVNLFGLPIVDPFTKRKFSLSELYEYLNYMEHAGVPILEGMAKVEQTPIKLNRKWSRLEEEITLSNNIKLTPQQEKVFEAVKDLFLAWLDKPEENESGCIITLKTGRGKSFCVASFFCWMQQKGHVKPHHLYAMWCLTPGSVVDKTKATFARVGVKNFEHQVVIASHDALSTKKYNGLFLDKEEDYYGNTVKVKDYVLEPPIICNVDEVHKYKKMTSKKTKMLHAWVKQRKTFWILTSASPFVTLADTQLTCEAIGVKHLGIPVTRATFKSYINTVKGNSNIPLDMPNDAAATRFRERNAKLFICPPDDPQRYRAYNHTVIVEWASEREKKYYFEAEKRWWEAKEKAGGDPSARGDARILCTIMRHAEESAKAQRFGERAIDFYNKGFAPVVALAFVDPIVDVMLYLKSKGVNRNEVSIIWGGLEVIDPKDLMTEEEAGEWLFRQVNGEVLSKEISIKVRKTMRHLKDRLRRHLDPAEKLVRDNAMLELGLATQSLSERYQEVERFLDGKTAFCLFTAAAGGTGIDLDHQRPNNRPRSLDATVTYYGEEVLQLLGRCNRIASLSDVHQHMLFLRGTMAHKHVAPKLDRKLSSIYRLATGGEDYVSLLEKVSTYDQGSDLYLPENFRTQAEIEAEEPEIIGDDILTAGDDDDDDDTTK